MCVYVVLDVTSTAGDLETIEIDLPTPSTNVTVSTGAVTTSTTVTLSGTTIINDSGVGWYDQNWTKRKKITIDSTDVYGSTNLLDFPFLVGIASDSDLQAYAQSDGADILFTSSNGTSKLDHEIDLYTSGTGQLYAWIRIPSLSPTVDTTIYMYYGNPGATNQQNITATWSSLYKAVYHMSQDPGGTAPQILDSTIFQNDGTSGGSMSTGNLVTGKINKALEFNGTDQSISLGSFNVNNLYTISGWFNTDSVTSTYKTIFGNLHIPTLNFNIYGSNLHVVAYDSDSGSWGDYDLDGTGSGISSGNWYYYAFTVSGAALSLYFNGEPNASTTLSATDTSSYGSGAYIGQTGLSFKRQWWDGLIDELRVTSTSRTADWIKTEYYNQNVPSDTIIIDPEQENGTPDAISNLAATPGNTQVSLTWSAPNDNGYAISDYVVQYKLSVDSSWTTFGDGTSSSTGATVTSLTNGQLYNFRVAAVNAAGNGPYSNVASATPTSGGSGSWYNPSWGYRKKITIDEADVYGSGSHTNFPFVVGLSSDTGLSTYAQADGDDILFTSSNGTTKLDHEIESYNSSTGALVAWVRIPSLSATVDTEIFMYYGYSGASNQQNPTGVWNSDYSGVWHMNNDPSGSSPQVADSTSNNNDGVSSGSMTSGDLVSGQIGTALDFDGTDDYISVANASSLNPTTAVTFSAWSYFRDTSGGGYIIGKPYTSNASPWHNFRVYHRSDNDRYEYSVTKQTNTSVETTSASTYAPNNWRYVTVTYDGTDMKLYVDGNLDKTTTSAGTLEAYATSIYFGREVGTGRHNGIIDEGRISTIARDADWIKTEYYNQVNPSNTYTLDPPESGTSSPVVSNVTVNGGSNITLTENTTTTVNWTATITDSNGYADIISATGRLYRSGVVGGASCSANNNSCYIDASCSLGSCAGTSCTATCSADIQFHADPTASGTIYSTQYWLGKIEATDSMNLTGSGTSPSDTTDISSLVALNVTPTLTFSSLAPGQNTGGSNQELTVTNTGNVAIDSQISGTNLCLDYPTCALSSIPVGNLEYSVGGFTYGGGSDLTTSPSTAQINLGRSTTAPSIATAIVYWGIGIPSPLATGSFSGQVTVNAIAD